MSHSELTQQSGRIVRTFYEAGSAGDMDAALEALHDDFVLIEPPFLPYGGVHHGHSGFQSVVVEAAKIIDLGSLRVESIVAEGESVIGIVRLRLCASDAEATIVEEWKLRDGKLASGRIFWFDPAPALP